MPDKFNIHSKIYVAGHRGLVGSALVRRPRTSVETEAFMRSRRIRGADTRVLIEEGRD